MGQWYWISEYLKLLFAYGFVLYVWPQVVFENHLKGKSLSYRYGFCVTVTVLLVSTAVLVLGLIHCLRPWVTSLLFLGVFFWRLFVNHPPFRNLAGDIRARHHETMSTRRLLLRTLRRVRETVSAWIRPVRDRLRGHYTEYGLLLIALIFGTIYFSWGAFDEHSYGFGDQYVHHQWIHGLTEGKAFYNGIYPEAMHCIIYLTCTLFRIRLYSGVLFFAGLHIHVLLICAWLFMKAVSRWKYTPAAALALFLCMDQLCIDEIFAMSRLSWTLPMEYAMYAVFLSGFFLLRFLRRVLRGERVALHPLRPKQWGVLHDEDLFLFSASVAVTIAVHFYMTIVAFIMCAVIALVYIRQVFRRGSFLPLAAAALLSLAVAVAPMAAAFALGYPLQGSLYWALRVVERGEENSVIEGPAISPEGETDGSEENAAGSDTSASEAPSSEEQPAVQTEAEESPDEVTAPEPPAVPRRSAADILKDKARILYWAGYYTLFPGDRSKLIIATTVFAIIVTVLAHMILGIYDISKRRKTLDKEAPVTRDSLDGMLIVSLLSVLIMIMYSAAALGIPELVAGSRLCTTEQFLIVLILMFPLDCLMALLARICRPWVMKAFAVIAFAGVYAAAQLGGFFHSYLYFELTRYNAAVEMTNHIIDTLPRQSYTIISTTDELYQVIEDGYHEELLKLVQNDQNETYTVPTQYLLLYIEKRPIVYAQYHFADGPSWLALKKYPALYESGGQASQCPDVLSTKISVNASLEELYYGSKLSDSATDKKGRRVLESRAYMWYRDFSSMHPRDCRVIYEDDDFMCCSISQNPGNLYTLGIAGGGE